MKIEASVREYRTPPLLLPSPSFEGPANSSVSAAVLSSRLKDREVEIEALRERLLKFETKLERVQQESKLELQECIRGYQLKLDEVRTNFETMLKIEVGTMLTSSSTAMNENDSEFQHRSE